MSESWETFEDLQSAFAAASAQISKDQLERWRGKGLLPKVQQVGRGRATGGSDVRYPIGTATQALAIARHLGEKRKLDRIGWELWIEGFQVDDAHWRIPLENARNQISTIHRFVQKAVARDENNQRSDRTIFDWVDIEPLRDTPIYAAVSRLSPDQRATAARIAAEILLGRLHTIGADELGWVKSVLGLAAQVPGIGGQRLDFSSVDRVLANLSAALRTLDRLRKLREPPIAVRHELANAQAIAIGLYRSAHWLFKGALNLRTAERIFNKASVDIQAALLLIWVQYRAIDTELNSAEVIGEMAEGARQLAEIVDRVRLSISAMPIEVQSQEKAALRNFLRRQKSRARFSN